ncbi:E3 SUMO-protein ligase ZBED1-like [Bufo bufo]|uniref:E3 SUMO-protein ligase ZBED1-like n=1 Tax=Bufo bufo TaxID=8384 RepID=UPI001ABDE1F3|nr:E3 SUMO-protein ligase ZBED1-like [Bufo bufo]
MASNSQTTQIHQSQTSSSQGVLVLLPDETEQTSQEEVVVKPNCSAPVWKFFGFEKRDAGGGENSIVDGDPICRQCRKHVKAKGGRGKRLCDSDKGQLTQPTTNIKEMWDKRRPYDRSSPEWKKCTHAITKWLVKDMMPMYTVQKEPFHNMIKTLNPRYEIPDRKYFSSVAIPKMYHDVLTKVQLEVSETLNHSNISLTCDGWTSQGSFDPYWTVTSHWVDSNFNLVCRSLDTFYMPEAHTAANLAVAIKNVLSQWEIPQDKVTAFTTDNGSNIVKALREMSQKRIPCFGHCLHLAVMASLDDDRCQAVIRKCRLIVSSFSSSWKLQLRLCEKQTEQNLPNRKIVGDCKTRWGSTYNMLSRIWDQKDLINAVLTENTQTGYLELNWSDRNVLSECLSLLKEVSDLTDLLSGEEEVTSSSLLPLLDTLYSSVFNQRDTDTEMLEKMKRRAKVKLTDKYSDSQTMSVLEICTALDPRYKLNVSTDPSLTKQRIENELIQIQSSITSKSQSLPSGESSSTSNENSFDRARGLAFFLSKNNKLNANTQMCDEAALNPTAEMELYFSLAVEPLNTKPLQWWKHSSEIKRLPLLCVLAKKYLAIQATAVASERMWSKGGLITGGLRGRLKPSTVSNLIFLSKNE